ncbi:hypothetical protein RMATCC62417_05931 [Rhizopus microsporus]|nr:hypothetical protein RMATCC62417_05931 [Rhizopus microsporus]
MNSSIEINITAYSPVPELQVTDIAQYKKIIESHVVKYGFKWIIRKTARNDITDQDLDGARATRYGRSKNLAKKSKKIGCKARLIATCYFSNPEKLVITVDGNHCHVLGSAEDLQYLPQSANVNKAILQRLQEGYNTRSVRFAMHRAFRSHNEAPTSIPHRDSFIHSEDVYNIFRKVLKEPTRGMTIRKSLSNSG